MLLGGRKETPLSLNGSMPEHLPVLVQEVLAMWHSPGAKFYVDGTVGEGGHTEALLKNDFQASCLGLDVDSDALAVCQERLKPFQRRCRLLKNNYARLPEILMNLNFPKANGILLDLGVSSLQLNKRERGFSFISAGPMDMRMGEQKESALEMIRRLSREELASVLDRYGEERYALTIASALKRAASQKTDPSTTECSELVEQIYHSRKSARQVSIHPATRTFQALRIAVNRELENLRLFLESIPQILAASGRCVIISFHSLEDRMVKKAFATYCQGCTCPSDFPVCACGKNARFRSLTRTVTRPTAQEIKYNPRSRSAKMRVIERIYE